MLNSVMMAAIWTVAMVVVMMMDDGCYQYMLCAVMKLIPPKNITATVATTTMANCL